MGLERIALMLDAVPPAAPQVAVVAMGDVAIAPSLRAVERLHAAGLSAIHCGGGGGKRQFKVANRERVAAVVILGDDEIANGCWSVRNMVDGSQEQVAADAALARIRALVSGEDQPC